MTTYARIEAGKVAELFSTDGDMSQLFHPDLIWVAVPSSDVKEGWIYQNGEFYLPAEADPAAIKARMWESIKFERDRRTQTGGYRVGDFWFHSDSTSRDRQLGLNALALLMVVAGNPVESALPGVTPWKTMDGTEVTMTVTLAQQILLAAAASDSAIFEAAKAHKAAMEASADPAAYDFSGGWPPAFGE